MKLFLAGLLGLVSVASLAADFCVVTPYKGSKSFKHSYHINCGQGGDRFLSEESTKEQIAKGNLMTEMAADGFSYVGTFSVSGKLLFATENVEMNDLCVAYPGSSDSNYTKNVFKIDCNDNALTTLYAKPVNSKGVWKTHISPNEFGKQRLQQYMDQRNYSALVDLDFEDSSFGLFSYLFKRR